VAHEVGAPEGTVKAWLSRGRTALAALLADDHRPDLDGGFQEGASRA
jgi:RNA polymerase sigma-70 factor (ECF subfamily)